MSDNLKSALEGFQQVQENQNAVSTHRLTMMFNPNRDAVFKKTVFFLEEQS